MDSGEGPGAAWRGRWDSLRLFTPARLDALPGLTFPGDPDRLPTKDEVGDYLGDYRARFDLPVRWRTRVQRLTREGDAYVLETSGKVLTAHQVVIATGPFQRPRFPAAAGQLGESVRQMHASAYRRPDEVPDGPVLVVGGGNSGLQIAAELSRERPTALGRGAPSVSAGARGGPQRVLVGATPGLDDDQPVEPARPMSSPAEGSRGRQHAETVAPTPGRPSHSPRRRLPSTCRSWARTGGSAKDMGRTACPGLYTLGIPWQRSNGSALLAGIGRDAALLAREVAAGTATVSARLEHSDAAPYGKGRP